MSAVIDSILRLARGRLPPAVAIGLQASEARQLAARACDLLESGHSAEAATLLEGLLFLNAKDAQLWFALGAAYEECQRTDDAARAFTQAGVLGHRHPRAAR